MKPETKEVKRPSIFGSWWTWRDNLIADYNNASEEYVSTLFDQLK